MVLATCTLDGKPSARVVLLKGLDATSFHFYSNYSSRKGRELDENPHAALVFNWLELHRQVRVEGRVERMDPEGSRDYFQKRPKGRQIGAWVSPQSTVIPHRAVLDDRQRELDAAHAKDQVLPLPPFWGGYRVIAEVVEFWQGRRNRLHDRLRYRKEGQAWVVERLAP